MNDKIRGIRLVKLRIENYKKIDLLEIDFPSPLMEDDPDILVFGSKNGGGKTSILECCALVTLAGVIGEKFNLFQKREILEQRKTLDIINLLIKSGQIATQVEGIFQLGNKNCVVSINVKKTGEITLKVKGDKFLSNSFDGDKKLLFDRLLNNIFSFSSELVIVAPLLYFNSYRKIQKSNPDVSMLTNGNLEELSNIPVSYFKLEIVRSLMAEAGLFEGINQSESKKILSQANKLFQKYCNGEINQLQLLADNTMGIRIKSIAGNPSFSFDGLSSGQKEMIATLFLIWRNTREEPCIVLIDEPELHLNAEWQSDFIDQLYKLAPNNQYIIATHSREIFRSVDEPYRAVLDDDINGG